jgi:hypothetical protein
MSDYSQTDAEMTYTNRGRKNQVAKIFSFAAYRNLKAQGFSNTEAAIKANIARTSALHLESTTPKVFHKKVDMFLMNPEGKEFLDRMLMSVLFFFCIDSDSGIKQYCKWLTESNLSEYVASSYGYWQDIRNNVEQKMIEFETEQTKVSGNLMEKKEITIKLDEVFFSNPCLVCSDAESNFLLLEKFATNRTTQTWKTLLTKELSNYKITVIQGVSDQGAAIKSMTEIDFQAQHSPDLFHLMHDLTKYIIGPLSRRKSYLRKELQKNNDKNSLEYMDMYAKYKVAEIRIDYLLTNVRNISYKYHPIDLETGEFIDISKTLFDFHSYIAEIFKLSDEINIDNKELDAIKKVEKMLIHSEQMFHFFCRKVDKEIAAQGLQEESDVVKKQISIEYYNRLLSSETKLNKVKLKSIKVKLEEELASLTNGDISDKVMSLAENMANLFHRTSSSIEGRNGLLSKKYHVGRGISDHKLHILTILHNYHTKRYDGTSAAERFFKMKHESLFSYVCKTMKPISLALRKKVA